MALRFLLPLLSLLPLHAAHALDLPHLARAVAGHLAVLHASRPVDEWLADPTAPAELRQRLRLAQELRDFAVRELALPDNASYRRYADLGRPAVLWNVVAAPELSFELKTWCWPVVGCVGYRGHFDEGRAQREAEELRAQGLEVLVYPVPAYSTLGWTNLIGGDPLLNTFAIGSPIELARLMFHELAHQVAYAPSDMAFSESFATAVEQLGLQRWREQGSSGAVSEEQWRAWEVLQQRRAELGTLVRAHREALHALYRSRMADEARRARKVQLREQFEAAYRRLRDSAWQGDRRFDAWVAGLNNAALALQSSYHEGVPAIRALFEREGRRFPRLYEEVRRLATLSPAERAAALQALDPARP